jgi:hypothetical protein
VASAGTSLVKSSRIDSNTPGRTDQVHLVDGQDEMRDAEEPRDAGVPSVCSRTPWRVDQRMATSAVDAPVARLRVLLWPGCPRG